MNIQSFKIMVNTYGAVSDRWPKKFQHESQEFLEKDSLAKQCLLQEAKLDEWLNTYQVHELPHSLQDSIFQKVDQYSQHPMPTREVNTLSSKLMLLAVCALAGFLFAKIPFLLHLLHYENARMFIQFEQMLFQQNEE